MKSSAGGVTRRAVFVMLAHAELEFMFLYLLETDPLPGGSVFLCTQIIHMPVCVGACTHLLAC